MSPASGSGSICLGYAIAGLRAARRMRSFAVEIEENGVIQAGRTVHLAVGNGRHYGGGMTVSEEAEIDDARLDIYSLDVHSFWRLLVLLPAIRHGRHGHWREVRTAQGADIIVRTRQPRSVNTDGEITTQTPVRFRVLPKAVEAFAAEDAQRSVGGAFASMAVKVSRIS